MRKQLCSFLLHLRLHYNFLILSAPFLLGTLYVPAIADKGAFLFLFIVLYALVVGGVNAYNSYFDKDKGPIGGLEHPPVMERWMLVAAWGLQFVGLALSVWMGIVYTALVGSTVVLSWLYSGQRFRLKGRPIMSLVVIAVGVPLCMTLLGYLAAGGIEMPASLLLGAMGVSLIVVSMYPFSQIYQVEEDAERGDVTFAIRYGISGVRRFYAYSFPVGVALLALSLSFNQFMAVAMLIVGTVAYWVILRVMKSVVGIPSEYRVVMKTKYYGGIAFTLAVVALRLIR